MSENGSREHEVLVVASRGRVCGLDRRSGHLLWEVVITTSVDHYYGGLAVELLITEDRVYAASWKSQEIVCIDYPSGREIGRVAMGLSFDGRPNLLIEGDQLFVAREGQVACFTLDGQPLWTNPLRGKEEQAPTAIGFPGNVRHADDRYRKINS